MPNVRHNRRLIMRRRVTSGDAAETTAFLARTTGLDASHIAAYKDLINGLVADGVFAKLDFLHVYATDTTTNALLNLVSASYGGTVTGTPTFTADRGYAGGSGNYISSGFVPSTAGGLFAQDSASMGYYDRTAATGGNNGAMGACNSGSFTNIAIMLPNGGDTNVYTRMNSAPDGAMIARTTNQGFWIGTRTGSSAVSLYKNGSSIATSSTTSTGRPNQALLVLGANGPSSVDSGLTDQIAAAFAGAALNSTDASNFSLRLNAYMTAVGASVY